MAANQADFTLTFRGCATPRPIRTGTVRCRDLFIDPTAFDDWAEPLAGAASR